ncbi:MAG: argininosuccinate lyase [Actinobacteria bacterium]|nr:argininosuccinate lyase [Actinomycetota bacterium]
MNRMWGGRFNADLKDNILAFTESLSLDYKLLHADVVGSIAHCRELRRIGVMSAEELSTVIECLKKIDEEAAGKDITVESKDEDIHSYVERKLSQLCGEVAFKVHTARSRNDQVSLDMRIYLKDEIVFILELLLSAYENLLDVCKREFGKIFIERTHMQHAQPSLLSHHLLAYCEMFKRDFEVGIFAFESCDEMPLGSGACVGINYPVDRKRIAEDLNFRKITGNSADAVSNRDFIINAIYFCACIMVHLSRFCEEIICWSSPDMGFVEIPLNFTTGSSIMPQKKNPDMFELIRGRSAILISNLVAMLALMKGQPLSYNRDMQEDKRVLFESVDIARSALEVFSEAVSALRFKEYNPAGKDDRDFIFATDVADYLVKNGIPFRKAHEIVGRIVLWCEENDASISSLGINKLREFSPIFNEDVFLLFDFNKSIDDKDVDGGTSHGKVKEKMEECALELVLLREKVKELSYRRAGS